MFVVIFADGKFVASGSGSIVVSSDGTNWTDIANNGLGVPVVLAYEEGLWVGVSNGGIIASTNASNWTVQVASPGYLTDLAYGNGRFVTVGWKGVMWISDDGLVWTNGPSLTGADFDSLDFEGGFFHVSFQIYDPYPFKTKFDFISKDGIEWWNPATNGASLNIRSDGSTSARLSIGGIPGNVYHIESSPDLVSWSSFGVITNSAWISTLPLPITTNSASTFFRAVAP